MKPVLRIKVDVALGLTEETLALLGALFPNANIPVSVKTEKPEKDVKPAAQPEKQPQQAQQPVKQAQPAQQSVQEPTKPAQQVEQKPVEKQQAEQQDSSSITIEKVRTLLGTKINDFRDDVKNKLDALGAKNLSSLNPADYGTFYNFLMDLKK